ncbi:MAG: HNH endonuclease [Deltaproteobacteria bacterium]|nr:HNH endonuclease [Deltaproteobacteria bacterium]
MFCAQIAEAKIPRSRYAIAEFKQMQPCPANDNRYGPCPGWQIDHVIPLKCKGPDRPDNMQWLTVKDHKAKTAREAKECRRK